MDTELMPPKSRRQYVCSNWGWEVAGGIGRGGVRGWMEESGTEVFSFELKKKMFVVPEYV